MGNKHENKDKSAVEQNEDIQVDINSAETSELNNLNNDASEKLNLELQEAKEKYLRLVAEFDNFRKRVAKERLELMQTAGKDVIAALLDTLDDSDRAQQQLDTTNDIEQIKQGVSLVFSKMKNILQTRGLKPMESIGQDFDPDKHEAVAEIDTPENMKGKVVDEVQKGYYLNDKIIRFAKVIVGK